MPPIARHVWPFAIICDGIRMAIDVHRLPRVLEASKAREFERFGRFLQSSDPAGLKGPAVRRPGITFDSRPKGRVSIRPSLNTGRGWTSVVAVDACSLRLTCRTSCCVDPQISCDRNRSPVVLQPCRPPFRGSRLASVRTSSAACHYPGRPLPGLPSLLITQHRC